MGSGTDKRGNGRRRSRWRLLAHLVDHRRTGVTDFTLALVLAFIAGGINAGGFIAVGRYTSHMTGYVSETADHVALADWAVVGVGLVAVAAFLTGAALSAVLIHWARRHTIRNQYALPLSIEALLLLVFGAVGIAAGGRPGFALVAAPLLCVLMGLQNATITKLSGARMRTTHVTGVVTDMGIEMGKAAYRHARADRRKLILLTGVLLAFFFGGVVGALGFGRLGYGFTIPLAVLLLVCAVPGVFARRRGRRRLVER